MPTIPMPDIVRPAIALACIGDSLCARASRRSALAMLAALITGCASIYTEPSSGPTATVTYVAGYGVYRALVHKLDGESCGNPRLIAVIGPKPSKVTFSDALQIVLEKTVKVRADVPVVNQIQDSRTEYPLLRSCLTATTFQPKPGLNYRVVWTFGPATCEAHISTLNETSGLWSPEASARKIQRPCVM